MLTEDLRNLGALLIISLPFCAFGWFLHRGRVPFLRFRTPREAREPALWNWLEVVVVIAFWIVMQNVFALLLLPLARNAEAGAEALSFAVIQILTAVFVGRLVHTLLCVRLGQPPRALGFAGTAGVNFVAAVVLGFIVFPPLATIHAAWGIFLKACLGLEPALQGLVEQYKGYVDNGDWLSIALVATTGVIVAPAVEEMIFRGVVFGPLRLRWGAVAATGVSSLFFALLHLSLTAFLPLFFLGCVLCYVRERSGSLYPAMLLHSVFNSVTFAGLLFSGTG